MPIPLRNESGKHLGSFQLINPDALHFIAFSGSATANFSLHSVCENQASAYMNGRMYDPVVSRMLAPDNFVQTPDFSQNFNRYSYALNNPLMFTDPSGEFLTWSFSKNGFSIGFNLTPIGIPVGAGINIGWSDGASLGGYSEVGYRVGGTGFGSGVTVSQSFDYNFKHSGWSTTTTEGAYASLGPFNAGINFSQTYGMSSKQWSNGWGASAGVGIGNDASGIGFNVGYGSGGWSYGIGGYYNSKAWESNPVYAPDEWNDNGVIQNTNNCYSYALDERENGSYWGLQPGEAGGQPITTTADLNLNYVTNAAISDGRIKKPTLLNKLGFRKRGFYSVYLVSADGVDYHWYRQDKGGMWSHKPGITSVVNVDASGRFISNPVRANHGIYNNGGILLWVKRR
jgi:RHS repeat-associated protein